ncbi:hypothetical protein C4553_03595 [Candidatus Parcubacteria bacterium]|nr:MAG: hypothetical protein C4553_03595 [Candidatus Parcubacteria bacterium]
MKKTALGLFLLGGSGLVTWHLFWFLGSLLKSDNPGFMATTITLAIGIHELFHLLAFESVGMKSYALVHPLGGITVPFKTEIQKIYQVHWSRYSGIALVGLIGNALIVCASTILNQSGLLTNEELSKIVNFNGALMLFCLLPLWETDGHLFAKALFDSIPEHQDMPVAHALTVVAVAIFGIAVFASAQTFAVPGLLVVYGLRKNAHEDEHLGSKHRLAMTTKQRWFWTAVYFLLLSLAVFFICISQPWWKI